MANHKEHKITRTTQNTEAGPNDLIPRGILELANDLPFVPTDLATHDLLQSHTFQQAQQLQIALGKLRRAGGHFQGTLLALDPHRMTSYSQRQMRRHPVRPMEQRRARRPGHRAGCQRGEVLPRNRVVRAWTNPGGPTKPPSWRTWSMNVFAFADMVGQIFQQNSLFLPVCLRNRAGKRVDFGGDAFSRTTYPARCLFVHRHQFLRILNLAMIGRAVNVLRLATFWPGASAYPLHKKAKADIVGARPASWDVPFALLHLDRDLQAGGIPDVPFLNVEAADDGGFALDLNLGELHGVLRVFLFLELNGFGFVFHDLILVDGFRLIDIFLAQVFSQSADTLGEDWHGVKPLTKKVVASNHRAASENSGGHFFVIPQSSADCGVCFAGDIQAS